MGKFQVVLAMTALVSLSAEAALIDRGNGMIYDTTQDITWMQDAYYSQTSGYTSVANANWAEANAFVDQLSYGGYDDWRLATITEPDPVWDICTGFVCAPNYQYVNGELGQLFYNELGNTGYGDEDGNLYDPAPVANFSFIDGETGETVSFLFPGAGIGQVWYGQLADDTHAYSMNFKNGTTGNSSQLHYKRAAWAVRDGDVSVVPIPAAIWLFGSGLGLLGWMRRKPTA